MRKTFLFLPVLLCLFLRTYAVATIEITAPGVFTEPDTSDLKYLNWYNAYRDSLNLQGTGADKAFNEILNSKKSNTVIVAVIDGGVDIKHEDLEGRIWTNVKEIENNGIDDDQNGYVDDIHGWNFLGNQKGENINYETYELTRIVKKFGDKFNLAKPTDIKPSEQKDYGLYIKAKAEFDEKVKKYTGEKEKIDQIYKGYIIATQNIKSFLNKDTLTSEDIKWLDSDNDVVNRSRKYLLYLNENNYSLKVLEDIKENNYNRLFYHLNLEYNPREIIGDDPEKQDGKMYGNNNVSGDQPEHGTFVSGIIAGVRHNNKGINGIAGNVLIMPLRVIPDGDERDKDIANAILYAVNNGAQVINCSFGKGYSPQKEMVDAALKIAQQKDVIIVHSSGNEASDNDVIPIFPTDILLSGESVSDNWLTIGASSMKADKNLPGVFSNYGIKDVDIFAPGVDIYSLHPGNTYEVGDGTSYACPVVSGVVALLKSYYPELSSRTIKTIILQSATKYPKLKVYLPDKEDRKKKKIRFEKLSVSGGVVNAYEAVKLAEQLVKSGSKPMPK